MRLLYVARGELLEALGELNEAARKVQVELDESRQALGRQSGKEIWPFALSVNGRIKKSWN